MVSLLSWAMLYGTTFDLGYALLTAGPPQVPGAWRFWAGTAYLAIIGSVVTFPLHYNLVREIGAGRTAYNGIVTVCVAMGLSTLFEGFKWDALTLAAGNMSLFGGAKLIDLRIPTGKPGRDGGDALQRYSASLPAQTLTLITLPEVDWATRKTVWFKALADAATTLELNAPERERLPEWVGRRLAAHKQSAPPEALAFIADHVEGNLLAAHQEILKLGLLHPEGALTLEQIQDAVLNVARYDIDKLRQALIEGDPARCARLLEGLKGEGAAPPLVLWALANETRIRNEQREFVAMVSHEFRTPLSILIAEIELGKELNQTIDDYKVSVLITLSIVMGGFLIAKSLHVSSPLAMVVAGLRQAKC